MYKHVNTNTTLWNGNAMEDEHHFRHTVKYKQYCFHFNKNNTKCLQMCPISINHHCKDDSLYFHIACHIQ